MHGPACETKFAPNLGCVWQGTDELEGMGSDGTPNFSAAFKKLLAFADRHPEICIVDPLEQLRMTMDRSLMASILAGLAESGLPTGGVMPSAPACMQVRSQITISCIEYGAWSKI